jgi:hypothetical protein
MASATRNSSRLMQALQGGVPCVRCSYSLRGLSITGNCPECGTPIRTTLLFTIDPHAPQLRPLPYPRFVGNALFLGTVSGLVGAILLIAPWAMDGLYALLDAFNGTSHGPWIHSSRAWLPAAAVLSLLVTMLSCLALYSPVLPTPLACRVCILSSVLGFLLLFYSLFRIQVIDIDLGLRLPFPPTTASVSNAESARALYRLLFDASLATIFLLIRPTARLLVFRSLALRTGRVARQTIYPMAVAAGVAMVGDLLRYLAIVGASPLDISLSIPYLIGEMTVWVATGFILLGLLRSVIDTYRIRASLCTPSPSLHDLLAAPSKL